jgi:hypothetical protein
MCLALMLLLLLQSLKAAALGLNFTVAKHLSLV